jgi:predicted acylesterase/phospholipase RssA
MMAKNESTSLASHPNVLLIRPGRPEIEYYDFRKIDALIDAGYSAGNGIREYLL